MDSTRKTSAAAAQDAGAAVPIKNIDAANFERHPDKVLAVLEADQLVAAKERVHFGRRQLSVGVRALLWSLRVYVLIMMALVVIQVVNAVRAGH